MNELGEWLRRARESRGLTLEDAERDTRISRRYLHALETGELELIPAPVYARGFLRSYAQYLGLDPQEAMARYPREETGMLQAPPAAPQRLAEPRGPAPAGASRTAPFGRPRVQAEAPAPRPAGNRPAWRRPGPQEAAPAGAPPSAPAPQDFSGEPMIGVDIGVPVPARRLQRDPAGQTKSVLVLGVAAAAVLGILAVAFLISRLGGDESGAPVPSPEAGKTATGGGAGTTPTAGPVRSGNGIVPSVVGKAQADAVTAINAAGLTPNIARVKNEAAAGSVIEQSPAAGTQMERGDPVTIVVSEGP